MTRNPVGDGEQFSAVYWSGMVNAIGGEAVVSGCAPSKGTGSWDVDIASGEVKTKPSVPSVSTQTVTLTTPGNDTDLDSGEFRVDLITVDSTGTVNVAEGVAGAKPIAPDIPTDEVLVAAVLVDGSASSLSSSDIKDYRVLKDISPVRVTDEASSFTEGDVTVTHSDTELNNGSIQLRSAHEGTTASVGSGNDTQSVSDKRGVEITPNVDISGVKGATLSNSSGLTTGYLTDTSGTVLGSASISSGTFLIEHELSAGTSYYLVADAGGSSYTEGQVDPASFPYNSSDVDIVGGIYNGTTEHTAYASNIKSVTSWKTYLSGSATIEWPAPTDIEGWDLATYQRTLDGETATIDVLDGSDTVLFSDISQNFDISTVAASTNVKLRVNLSRSTTSNNPTLDYAARRYVR